MISKSAFVTASLTVLSVIILFVSGGSGYAATRTVTSASDNGFGSLRDVLADAQSGDTINFAAALNGQTIILTTDQLTINTDVTIIGPAANLLTIKRSTAIGTIAFRIFQITPGRTVTISGLTVSNGSAGGVHGGGIHNNHSTLNLNNCTLSANAAPSGDGGGIYNNGGAGTATLKIANCTLSGNAAPSGDGGGIYNDGGAGTATLKITNSTLSGNSAAGGGGIHNDGEGGAATLTINNSTLSGNAGTSGFGGGIFNFAGTVIVGNTLLKTGSSGANIYADTSFPGTISSSGYNLCNDGGDGYLTATGDQINIDPNLGPLQANGGSTLTHAPFVGSPAIDKGRNLATDASGNPVAVDQRGSLRPVRYSNSIPKPSGGDGSDIGAVELSAPPPPPASSFVAVDSNATGTTVGYYLPDGVGGRSHAATVKDGILTDYHGAITAAIGLTDSSGAAINDSEHFVGRITGFDASAAFLYAQGSATDLGDLPRQGQFGPRNTSAKGINNFDQVVGSSQIRLSESGLGDFHAFLWENGVMVDLNDLIDSSSGWELTSANAINNLGEISCTGTINGENHPYVYTPPAPPTSTGAVSRKTHGAAGPFDINLPIDGNPGIESRAGEASGAHQVVVKFAAPVTVSSAAVTSGTGAVGSFVASGNQVFVNLMNVANAQTITVALFGVTDGTNTGDIRVRMAILLGDVNSSRVVTSGDTNLTKAQALKAVTAATFRMDVNATGNITTADTNLVKSKALSRLN